MIETIGQAMDMSWSISARCAHGKRDGMKSIRECGWRKELDMVTLVATRGRDFPLARVAERLRCPNCGSRRVAVMYIVPQDRRRNSARMEII